MKINISLDPAEIEDLISGQPTRMRPVIGEVSRQYLRKILLTAQAKKNRAAQEVSYERKEE